MSTQATIGKLLTLAPLFGLSAWLFWQAFKDPKYRRTVLKAMLVTTLLCASMIGGCILQLELTAEDWQRMTGSKP